VSSAFGGSGATGQLQMQGIVCILHGERKCTRNKMPDLIIKEIICYFSERENTFSRAKNVYVRHPHQSIGSMVTSNIL